MQDNTKQKRPPTQAKTAATVKRTTKPQSSINAKAPPASKKGGASPLAAKVFGRSDKPQTVQHSIPYREMYKDGICRVNRRLYTKTIAFSDINYHLAQNEDKTQIFEKYCDFLNYFDSSVTVQLSFTNHYGNQEDFQKAIDIPIRGDEYDDIRREYADMLKNQMAKGNNGLVRNKYVTVGIEADNLKAAKQRLERVELDVLNNFKVLGVAAHALNGAERLEVMHGQLHPDGADKFCFSWKDLAHSGLSTKDYIAPSSFEFREGRSFRMGRHYGTVSFLQILAPELTDRMLADFIDLDSPVTVTLHIRSIDQSEAIKMIKRKLSDLDKMRIEEQKKAVRSGYDMDVLPPDLVTYGHEAKTLLEDLQSRNERMFLVTLLVMNTSIKKQKLENDVFAASGVAQKYNCALKRLDWQQEQGLMSSLPLGLNQIEIKRGLTTSSVAIFVPFTTCELFQRGEAMYYGLNALSNNLIMASRKELKNPNGLYLGTPGSGKSFAAKREIINVILTTKDRVIIVDPMGEYVPLVKRLGPDIGEVIEISPDSPHHINPMDLNLTDNGEESPLALKADFILSLMELVVGGKDGLQPIERTVIDRCTRLVYHDIMKNPDTAEMPILQDLYELLMEQPEAEAKRLATALEIYCVGSLNVFNNRSNVSTDKRVTCIVLNKLGAGLRKIAMHVTNELSWAAVEENFRGGIFTWCYYDEFHILLRDALTASYFVAIWKMLRKKGCVPSALTQNVKDLLASKEIENILENSEFMVMLSQAAGDREILARQLGISTHQLSYVTHSGSGEGLLFYGDTTIPFVDRFPKNTEIYRLLTTRPEDLKNA